MVLFISTLGAFITPFMSSAILVALPSIDKDFHMSTFLLNWTVSSFLLTSAVFVVPFGRLADIIGRKRIYFYGIIVFTAASFLCGVSRSAYALIFFRVLQGIGAAAIFGTSVAILTAAFSPEKRGRALGINVAATYVGLSAGPVIGGILTQHFGWQGIFFFILPIGVLTAGLAFFKIKEEWAEAKGEQFDLTGSLIYGTGLFGIIIGLSYIETAWWGPVLLGIGTASIVAFCFYESGTKNPVIKISLLKNNRMLVFSLLATLISYSATYAVSYLLSLYFQYLKGFGPQHAGFILITQPAVQAFVSPLAGKLSDHLAAQKLASGGMGITAAGLGLLLFVNKGTGIWMIIIGLATLGLGFGFFSSPNTNAVMSAVEEKFYGVTSGLLGTMRLMGQTLSLAITTLVFSAYMRGAQITSAYHPHFLNCMKTVFFILLLLCIFAMFASLARGKGAPPEEKIPPRI